MSALPATVDEVARALESRDYVADRALAVSIHLALRMGRPLFLEGEAGVGKTEVAKVLAHALGQELIRLQCHEGLDLHQAVYEWDYARQMLHIRLVEARGGGSELEAADVMSRQFLVPRPLLRAVEGARGGRRPVLLVDEIDRADEEFEAFLLEVLSDFQVTIPEIGTIRAEEPPVVVVTSNRTREIHDALKRRCLYHWIDYPDADREVEIVTRKVPGLSGRLARELAEAMARLREMELFKPPGVSETLDWGTALALMGHERLTPEVVEETLGVVLKYREDLERVRRAGVAEVLGGKRG